MRKINKSICGCCKMTKVDFVLFRCDRKKRTKMFHVKHFKQTDARKKKMACTHNLC